MKLSPLRLSFLVAAAACWAPLQDSQAALLVYEPFDYTSVAGSDQNEDQKKDLMGLDGGFGLTGAWIERTATTVAAPNHPLDYINDFDLEHSSGDPRFGVGGSLEIFGFTQTGQPSQGSATLTRSLAEPITITGETELWFSVLLRKNSELPVSGTTDQTRPGDKLEIGLANAEFEEGFYLGDPADSTSFAISSAWSVTSNSGYLDGKGPTLGTVNFLVMKLSFELGSSRMEFFYNPSLDGMSPTPDVTLAINDGPLNFSVPLDQLRVNLSSARPVWTLDEIRVGETYADVVPEPSSLLLTSFGVAMLGGARLRRSRVSRN